MVSIANLVLLIISYKKTIKKYPVIKQEKESPYDYDKYKRGELYSKRSGKD
jgi:hypothetical protein